MLTLTIENKKIQCHFGTQGTELLSKFKKTSSPLMALRLNNEILPLSWRMLTDGKLEPVYLNSKDGVAVYRRTLCFILAAAVHKLFPEKRFK